jgi:hypothetical protein
MTIYKYQTSKQINKSGCVYFSVDCLIDKGKKQCD